MYGLLIENVLGYIRAHYHPKRYEEVVEMSKLPFSGPVDIAGQYHEGIVSRVAKKACLVLQVNSTFSSLHVKYSMSYRLEIRLLAV